MVVPDTPTGDGPGANPVRGRATLVDLLRLRAEQQPDHLAYRFLASGEISGPIEEWSYAEVDFRARAIGALLQEAGAQGERALLLYESGLDFVAAFLGCSYGGVVAVPAYPPDPGRLDRTLPRLRAIARDCQARFILTTSPFLRLGRGLLPQIPELGEVRWMATDQPTQEAAATWRWPDVSAESLAFLQYTSGSTGQPKGVMVSHANLIHNEALIAKRVGHDESLHMVGWLPLFHDMGLIGNVLQPLYLGASCTLMSPLAFLERPLRWIEAVSRFRGTTSGGPNFAYDLCARRVQPADLERLDLSSWKVAFNGAEMVRRETLDRFAVAFSPSGFRPQAFYPCYGLAEATLFVTGIEQNALPRHRTVSDEALAHNTVVDVEESEPGARMLVSCGETDLGQRVEVVDPQTNLPCAPRSVGEIWVHGPSVAGGYWNRPEENARTFGVRLANGDPTPFLRTGDLGVLVDGELFVTGRSKDLIILRGRNLYPHDIEHTMEGAHPAVRPGGCAAFSVEVEGEERLAVAAEADLRRSGGDTEVVVEAIRRAVAAEHGAHTHAVVLLEPRSIPKTSSGKIQRHACRRDFLAGTLAALATSVVEGSAAPELEAEGEGSRLREELAAATPESRRELVEQLVREQLARALQVGTFRVDLEAAPGSLGLDSLMALDLHTQLEAALGVSLPEALLWQEPTGKRLAERLLALWETGQGAAERTSEEEPLVPAIEEPEQPLSSGQERLYFLTRLSGNSPVYNLHFALRMTGGLDVELLRRSLAELLRRHTVLRTLVREVEGRPCQVVQPEAKVDLRILDLSAVAAADREGALHHCATALASEPFDLSQGPLLRTDLARLGEEEHVLLLAQHHIVTDGWSVALIATELSDLYRAFADGGPPPPAPRLQFSDYARWERARKENLGDDRAYWERQLAGVPRLGLPYDLPRPPHTSFCGGRVPVHLPAAVSEGLAELGRAEGCTPFVALLAAYASLLHRYVGQEDFSIGSVVANRSRPELRDVLGFFANTIVLRCDFSALPTFRQMLRRLHGVVAEALAHATLPFEDVVQVAGRDGIRDGDDNPLFQTSFVLESNQVREMDVVGMSWKPLSWSPDGAVAGTAKFDLSLLLEETLDGFAGGFEFSSDRFEPATAQRMVAHLRTLLDGLLAEPDRPLDTLPLIPPAELSRILVEWNDTAAPVPQEVTFVQLFADQVARTPDAIAVTQEAERLTYRELDRRAGHLAHHLRREGVGPDVVVGLLLPRGIDLLRSILAIFKAGGAYLPLDPEAPARRHADMLNQAGVSLVVTNEDLASALAGWLESALPASPPRLMTLDGLGGPVEPAGGFAASAGPGDLAYVIFTSGSTGLPKGAMVEHRGMLNHLYAKLRDLELSSADTLAQTASQSFDISVWQLLAPLLVGGRVQVVSNDVALDPQRLFEQTARDEITVLEIVPSLLRAFLEDIERRGSAPLELPALRWLLLTGEALPPELARGWLERHPAIPLLNAYGPTECSDDVTHHPIRDAGGLAALYTPIGRPICNMRLFVADRWLEPVPVGVPGELYVGGIGVGRGYLRDPVRTAQSFVPDPFRSSGLRLYRTGDLCRYLADGSIEFLGRVDHQVKVRGFRVELGEVETALAEEPGVRQAVVVLREDIPGDRRLVAYVVLEEGAAAGELRGALARRLPGYMVPAAFVQLETMPLTPNGKVDRRALPAPSAERSENEETFVAPRTLVEELVAEIWAEVLGLERVGSEDEFFALGGHSLLATQVMARLSGSLGVELPLRALFEAPTVAALAARVEAARGGAVPPAPPIQRVARDGELPLSFAQQRLWFLDQLTPGGASYNVPGQIRIQGPLDVAALAASLREIVWRHEALRTRFVAVEGRPLQWIDEEIRFALPVLDLGELGEAGGAEVERLARQEARRGFDLEQGPLFRAMLLRREPEEHVLLLTLHHIVSDGWSLGVLVREGSALYAAFAAGAPSPLPELPVQYVDFSAWQRERLQGEVLEAQLGYWQRQLAGAPPTLELPTDRPRPAVVRNQGAQRHLTLEPELVKALRMLSRRRGATLYMTLLAAYQALLSRYSGQEDISVGSPIAGRIRTETEGLIGFFVNTLVMRTKLDGSPSFAELVGRVREVTLEGYEHQEVPFERLVETLAPQRDLGRTALFQVMFILQNAPLPRLELGAAQLEPMAVDSGTSKFELTLSLEEEGQGVRGWIEYDTDLFDAATAGRMLDHYRRLLAAAAAQPDLPVGTLPILASGERAQILQEWNDTATRPPYDRSIHELFEERAALAPDTVAFFHEGGSVTYQELNQRANRLAHHLLRLGIGMESRVGIYLGRSPELVVAMLGILKAGGAYVALDPNYPAERLRFMIGAAKISVALTVEGAWPGLDAGAADLTWVDVGSAAVAMERDDNPGVVVPPNGAAYVVFTSGSTGTPNGVLGHHGGALNRFFWMWERYPFAPGEVFALKTSSNFVDSVWETFGPLLQGVPSVIVPDETAKNPQALVETLSGAGVTRLVLVPALLRALLDTAPDLADRLPHLRHWTSSGEALPPDLVERFWELLPGRTLLNLYGSSEVAADSTAIDMRAAANAPRGSIGRPIDNLRVYLLDRALEPVPLGVVGELYTGGAGVARGYLGNAARTAERFIPDPFQGPGERLYRTGDLCRYLAHGRIEFVGRVDYQVKIRGFRVELGEVEAALAEEPGVRQAVVVVREDVPGDRRLVAYLVLEEGAAVIELRRALARRLPGYMVPAAFVQLEALPLTPNGKVDRRGLPAPSAERWEGEEAFVAPRTPVEDLVAEVWAEVLGLERVGSEDEFFALGGHSLLATQVMARLSASLGVELPLRTLFEAPTVAALAARVEAARSGSLPTAPPIERVARDGELPLSFAQQRLWFLDQLAPGGVSYNVPGAILIRGPLDVAALEASLREIVWRHEALRTRFVAAEGRPQQQIDEEVRFALPVLDLGELGGAGGAEVERLAQEEARRGFDLERGPLFRAMLLRREGEEHVLLLTLHHIVSDGWSLGVLVREGASLYAAFSTGLPSRLPELPVQYVDFSAWQRERLRGEVLETQLGYWQGQLAGMPPALELPTDRPRPAVVRHRGAQQPLTLEPELVKALRLLGRRRGATLYMTLLAGYQALLSRISGQEDVAVGSPIAGRIRPETEGLIGFFVNTLVMRTTFAGSPGFAELVGRVREVTLESYGHQEVPFERLVEALAPQRDLGRAPLVQVMFILQNAPLPRLELGAAHLEPLVIDSGTSKFELTLSLQEDGQGVRGWLEYDTDLFDATTAVRLLDHYRRLLDAAVAQPDLPIAALPILANEEKAQILREWNDTATPDVDARSLLELFEEHAVGSPDAVAVVSESGRMTYAELSGRADRLAWYLHELGVGPETLVGLFLEQSPESVVALLGILKAGAAYLPLDLAAPPPRLRFMLEDAGARILVTSTTALSRLPSAVERVVCLDRDAEAIAAAAPRRLPGVASRDQLAYVMYTSGSTGRPKGVCVPQGAVVRLARATSYVRITPQDVLLHFAPISFDASTFEVWAALLNGASIAVADSARLSLRDLGLVLQRQQVTTLWLTAPLFHQMVDHHPTDLAAVRNLLAGGDVLSPRHVRKAQEVMISGCVINGYGPTENTTFTCCGPAGEPVEGASVPIGRPIDNTRVHLLDRELAPVPIGVVGELYTGGAGLARGYLGDAARTAERFVPDPFQGSGLRLYRTGDLCRYLADGRIEFLGRVDHQVKIRGFRVELGEVEAALAEEPGVRQAVVVLRGESLVDRQLVAYVVLEGRVAVGELRRSLARRLPGYMVPTVFVQLDELPLTENGKVDRRALPVPSAERSEGDDVFVAPRTPVEELVAEIWAEVLGLQRVGSEDEFFALGGHSLLATQVMARLSTSLGVELPLRTLFEAPTVAALAGRVEAARGGSLSPAPPIERVARDGELPLSFAQQRLWFLDQLAPGGASYNVAGAIRIQGPLNVAALAASLREIVRRHEALRTRFVAVEGLPQQRIDEEIAFDLPFIELRELGETGAAEVDRLARQEARRSFDLERGPLFRAMLLRREREEHVLLLTLHHIVSDGWSLGVLVREGAALYAAFSAGVPSPLPELPVQYVDFSAWQRERLRGEVLETQLGYWQGQLAGAPPALELPTDRPRPAMGRNLGAQRHLTLEPELVRALRKLGRHHGATLYMTLLAAYQALLSRYSGQEDISVGSPIAGRLRTETEGLIGFFVNTLVMRTKLDGSPSFVQLVERVREVTLEGYAHQEVPFERLVETLAPQRNLGRTALFQVMFILQNAPLPRLELGAAHLEPLAVDSGTAKFELTLTFEEDGEGVRGWLEYNTDLFDVTTAGRLVSHYRRLLTAAVAQPDLPVDALPILASGERAQILLEWNDTAIRYPDDRSLHQLFEENARRAPDAVAVAGEAGQLTYAELNSRANRLARHLLRHGVGPEVAVGVFLEPSIEMAIAVLGILKAGGCYLPLDPVFPRDRVLYIIEDSDVRVLMTRRTLVEGIAAPGVEILDLEESAELLAPYEDGDLPARATVDNRLYVIYTSGSTGRPKGVVIEQRQILRYVTAIAQRFSLSPSAHYAMLQPLAVDSSNTVLMPWVCLGGTLHVLPRDRAADPFAVQEYFSRHTIDVLKIAPSHLAALLEACPSSDLLPHDALVLGGEASHLAWAQGIVQPLAPATTRLFNHYGPTETTVGVLTQRIAPGAAGRASWVPLGRPLGNSRIHILDRFLEPVPVGVSGEIYIGGGGVARGYLNRPGLTAERFLPDPFHGPGLRLYRSGDLGRFLADGRIEFLGRIDHQVKIRGFRIELGEVEVALKKHAAVENAVVIARDDGPSGSRLVAYVVARRHAIEETEPASLPTRLRDFLKESLPDYMIPSAVVVLDALPLSPQGKVDFKRLPAPAATVLSRQGTMAPRNLVEAQLVEILEELLQVSPISVTDDFFEIGGHSLLAVRLMARIQRRFGRALPLTSLFRTPTIAHMATQMIQLLQQSAEAPRSSSVLVDIQPEGSKTPFFCVHPIGGGVLCYADLARALGRDRPFYALQVPDAGTLNPAAASIECMATLYNEEIQRLQPEGPYLLGGWSMGGLIAFEMARQLNERGHRVGLLSLFDTHLPRPFRPTIDDHDELPLMARFAADLVRLAGKDPAELWEPIRPLEGEAQQAALLETLKREGLLLEDGGSDEEFHHLMGVFMRNSLAVDAYSPRPIASGITLFRPSAVGDPARQAEEWEAWTSGGVELHAVPGDHYSMLQRPHVAVLAALLKSSLDEMELRDGAAGDRG